MFQTYSFSYADVSASMYGLFICDFDGNMNTDSPFGNKASIIETRLPERVRPITYKINRHNEPLEFDLIFASERTLDRYEMDEIAVWLTGHDQYQWLDIEQADMADKRYRCIISQLKPISIGWYPMAFEAHVVCDCPYAYGFPFSETLTITNGTEITFRNPGTAREWLYPTVLIQIMGNSGATDFVLTNEADPSNSMIFSGMPGGGNGLRIEVDNENRIITDLNRGLNLLDYFNFNFFRLQPGANRLTIAGKGWTSGWLTISGRALYNVGA